MIPRLTPRRTLPQARRSQPFGLQAEGLENAPPLESPLESSKAKGGEFSEHEEGPAAGQAAVGRKDRLFLIATTPAHEAPLSPAPIDPTLPVPNPFLADEALKSPLPQDTSADLGSCSGSDYSITPPVAGPRPWVLSAKRLGQDVRRKHSKRRRFRSKKSSQARQQSGFCLWKDANAPQGPNSSSDEEEEGLPFLFGMHEHPSQDRVQQYWEYCYGKPKAKGSLADPIAPQLSWSANRAPPAKGW